MSLPTVTRDQMQRIDETVPDAYGITVSRMMENAGYQVAAFIRDQVDADAVTVYAGPGNNGGDGLVAARRLHCWGLDVDVVAATRDLDGIRAEELAILDALDIPVHDQPPAHRGVALDGLLGYSIDGDPRPPIDSLITHINQHDTVVSIDVPTGVHPDTGEPFTPAVSADITVTLAMPFPGLDDTGGEVWVADIGVPPAAYQEFGFRGDIFTDSSLVRYTP